MQKNKESGLKPKTIAPFESFFIGWKQYFDFLSPLKILRRRNSTFVINTNELLWIYKLE